MNLKKNDIPGKLNCIYYQDRRDGLIRCEIFIGEIVASNFVVPASKALMVAAENPKKVDAVLFAQAYKNTRK